jgi:hypothetical protein
MGMCKQPYNRIYQIITKRPKEKCEGEVFWPQRATEKTQRPQRFMNFFELLF